MPRDRHLPHELLHREDVVAVEHRLALGSIAAAGRAVEDLVELVAARERDVELEEEAIELRLGQRVGALHLERVLRREDDERLVERVGPLADA